MPGAQTFGGQPVDSVFAPGLNQFSVSQTDSAGQFSSVLLQMFRPSQQSLTDAQPVVTVPGVNGQGTYSVSGHINSTIDAAHIGMVAVLVAVGDTSVYPPSYVNVLGMHLASLSRNADGTLAYSSTRPPTTVYRRFSRPTRISRR